MGEQPLPSLRVRRGELPETVLLPGDPGRAKQIAERLDGFEVIAQHREFHSYRGTYQGTPIAVISTGIGSPSAAIIAGGLAGALHATWCIRFRANHVVSGIGINILIFGLALFITSAVWNWQGTSPSAPTLNYWYIVGATFVLVILAQVFIFRTRWGLRLRVVGEKPEAADTAGINVHRTRYVYTIVNGMLCGLAGAFFFIGNYSPVGALGAALLFGFVEALQMPLQQYIPNQIALMLPYLLTVIILAVFIKRAQVPAALGQHYVKQ